VGLLLLTQLQQTWCWKPTDSAHTPAELLLTGAISGQDVERTKKQETKKFDEVHEKEPTEKLNSRSIEDLEDSDPDAKNKVMDSELADVEEIGHSRTFFMRVSGIEAIRKRSESRLVQSIASPADTHDDPDHKQLTHHHTPFFWHCLLPNMLLCICGIIRWSNGRLARLYYRSVLLVPMFLIGLCVYRASHPGVFMHELLPSGCYAFASLVGLISLQCKGVHDLLSWSVGLLEKYATSSKFSKSWHWMSFQQWVLTSCCGVCMILAKILLSVDPQCGGQADDKPAGFLSFVDVVCSGAATVLLVTVLYCQVHVTSALELAVESFCTRLVSDRNLSRGISEWDLLQAILRRAASVIDGALCMLVSVLLSHYVFTGLQILQQGQGLHQAYANGHCAAWWCGWLLPPWLLILYSLYRAASVTEQCCRVPTMVNSWVSDSDTVDTDIQNAVQYIVHSAAGFYIKGVRITSYMTMKVMYLLGVISFTIVSQSVLKD